MKKQMIKKAAIEERFDRIENAIASIAARASYEWGIEDVGMIVNRLFDHPLPSKRGGKKTSKK